MLCGKLLLTWTEVPEESQWADKRAPNATQDMGAVMSKRFLRWVETWIEENIPPGANPDLESHEAKAKRLSEKLFAEAAAAGFTKFETDEERKRVPPLVLAAVSDSTDFDIDAYRLKSLLAQEHEDGD
jgi:2-oxo-4-hydroxy-4-carboxy--5-ureidoimidazoline (OHCU) decarboxylase